MTCINLALIPTGSNIVENIIVGDTAFTLTGYTALQIKTGMFCEPGMYYNSADGLFYQDSAFTSVYVIADDVITADSSSITTSDTSTEATGTKTASE